MKMFREIKNINVPYKRQGLLHFMCLNYDILEEKQREKIVQACIKTTSEYYQPLFKLLTTDTDYYPAWRIANDFFISPNLLYKLRREFYKNWDEEFKRNRFSIEKNNKIC